MHLRVGPICSVVAACVNLSGTARAETVPVPNGSFESPDITFVALKLDSWQKNPLSPLFEEDYAGEWDTLVGVYDNTAPGTTEHIDNMDGGQAIFVWAVPDSGLSLDYHSQDNFDDPVSPHEFDTAFEPGFSYRLTVGVIGGGGSRGTPLMKEGATLELSLYYHDEQTNVIQVASRTITYSLELFPTKYHFLDFDVNVPVVSGGDPWAEKRIGIGIRSTTYSEALQGSYWDVDNVRLQAFPAPTITESAMTEAGFKFTLESAPGAEFELLSTSDPGLPVGQWSSILTFLNESGTVSLTNSVGADMEFFQVREVP